MGKFLWDFIRRFAGRFADGWLLIALRGGRAAMPKKGGKAAPVDDPETIAKKKKRIKEITDRWLNEANYLPDKALVDKIYTSQVREA